MLKFLCAGALWKQTFLFKFSGRILFAALPTMAFLIASNAGLR